MIVCFDEFLNVMKIRFFACCLLLLACLGVSGSVYKIGGQLSSSQIVDGSLIVIEAASSTTLYGYYIADCSAELGLSDRWSVSFREGFSQRCVWEVVAASGGSVYLRNLSTGYYMGNSLGTLALSAGSAYTFTVTDPLSAGSTTYNDKTRFPTGWDENSVVFLIDGTAYWLGNDAGTNVGMIYGNGTHRMCWRVYAAVEDSETEAARVALQACVDAVTSDSNDYTDRSYYSNGSVDAFEAALAAARSALDSGSASSADMYGARDALQSAVEGMVVKAGVPLPVADLLDVVFGADGSATDVSAMNNTVQVVGPAKTRYSKRYGRYMATFEDEYVSVPSYYYKVDYRSNTTFQNRLKDGHSLETVFRTRVPVTNVEGKWFSSHQSGGTGFLIKTTGNGGNRLNAITFLPNVGGYKWACSDVVPEVDVFYHVVGVWDKSAGKARIYINGVLAGEVDASGTLALASSACQWFCIGGDPASGSSAEAGGSWDVVTARVYDDALSSVQVELLWDDLVASTAKGSLEELVDEVRVAVDLDGLAPTYTGIAALKAEVEVCEAAIEANASSPEQYRALEAGLREAYSVVKKPVADVLDIQFNANGTATDISPMGNTVHKKGTVTVDDGTNTNGNLAFNKKFNKYFLQTNNTWGQAAAPGGYYLLDYAPDRTGNNPKAPSVYDAIADGFSVECYFSSRIDAVTNTEAKVMGGTSGGGWAVMCATTSNGNKIGGELTFLVNTGTSSDWKFAASGVKLEKDKYYHLIGVWDKTNNMAKVYIDGEFKGEVVTSGDLFTKGSNYDWIGVGCGTISTSGSSPGSVVVRSGSAWDVGISRIYDQPLSDYQVKLLWDEIKTIDNRFILGYSYPDGLSVVAGAHFPIHGEGFQAGDIITLTSREDLSVKLADTATLTARGAMIDIPATFTTGEYAVSVTRGEEVQELGSTTLKMADSMPKPSRVIAHRGWHTKGNNAAHNSRQSVRNAFEAGFYGCEIDVHRTTDGYLMVNHDFSIGGVTINQSTYGQVKDKTIGNGEKIPMLSDLFDIMKNEYPSSPTKLIIELKTNDKTDTLSLANSVVQAVKDAGLQDRVEYISFGLSAGRYVRKADPTAVFSYLSTVDPSVLVANDLQGADFGYTAFTGNPNLVKTCDNLGLYTNGWTANDRSAIIRLNEVGVDFITTDYPDIAQRIYDFYMEMLPQSDIRYHMQDNTGTFSGSQMLYPATYAGLIADSNPLYVDLSGVTVSKELTAKALKDGMPDNTLYNLPANSPLNGDNIIKGGQCANLVLTDGCSFAAPTAFTAARAAYTRTIDNEWGTICLPYEVSSNEETEYYQIVGIVNNALVVQKNDKLPAGTPALVRKISGDAISPVAANVTVTGDIIVLPCGADIQMHGSYEQGKQTNDANAYHIKDGMFRKSGNICCDAFRAYFTTPADCPSSVFSIITEDDITGIRAVGEGTGSSPIVGIYAPDGTRYGTLTKGVNVVKLENGNIRKIVVR